jgi:hypothetical protein
VILDDRDRTLLDGALGPAMQLAMRLVLKAASIMGAERLIPITFAHIDTCFYTGRAQVDFARLLHEDGASPAVRSWTNNGITSLVPPYLRGEDEDQDDVHGSRELMRIFAAMGFKQTYTCAPYQLKGGPAFGDHIAVGESNAVAYYNSVIGARTNKYGDFLDVACALSGKAPFARLHTDEGRRAELHFDVSALPEAWRREDIFTHLLGHHVGRIAGQRRPVVTGLVAGMSNDGLKAISSAVAASGGVELWHGVGITPEAPSLKAIFDGGEHHIVTADDLALAHRELSTACDGPLDAVALGTPHFSLTEFAELVRLLDGRKVKTALLVSTSRAVRQLAAAKGWIETLEHSGVTIPVDVCTYYSPRIRALKGRVMTNAAKWAYYAPGMLGVEVAFGSLKECTESAIKGEVWRDAHLWLSQ